MNQTFEQRIQAIENELKEIRKELEESLARYKQSEYPFKSGYIPHYDFTRHYRKGNIVKWVDGIEMKAKCDTVGNSGDWYDPTRYDEYGNILEAVSE